MPMLDLTGERYGRLIVLHRVADIGGQIAWECQCDCGNRRTLRTRHLRHSDARECKPCASRTRAIKAGYPMLAAAQRPTYIVWQAIKARCLNPRHEAFYRYGGRGIQVCDRWRASFETFLSDMGPRPSQDHSIDRIDNNMGYEPGNCRWATKAEQDGNRRDCYRIRHNGEVLSLAQFCRIAGLKKANVYPKIARRRWGHDIDSGAILAICLSPSEAGLNPTENLK